MSQIVTHTEASHYYWPDGRPCYEVEMKSKKGEMRSTTLADARKLGLIPSVTTYLSLLSKPFLTSWKIEQAIMAALTLPAIDGESIDDRARRIVRDADQQADDARKLGTLIHSAIEDYVLRHEVTQDPTIKHLFYPFKEWWDANCVELVYSEKSVVHHQIGYAGRVDCKAKLKGIGLAMIDFKSRKPTAKGAFATYDDDAMQLSAYREADSLVLPRADTCVSFLINSQEPGIHIHQWSEDDLTHAWECFKGVCHLWQKMKKFELK